MSEVEVPVGWESERKLAGGWGLRFTELVDYRKVYMRPEYHWRRFGLGIYYSPEGIAVAKKHFNAPDPVELYERKVAAKREEYARWAPPPGIGAELSERVCRVLKPLANPRMLRVVDVAGKLAHVRVRSTVNFREGMLVDLGSCRVMYEEPDGHSMRASSGMDRPVLYELMIPLPRYLGRWGYDVATVGYIGRSGAYFKRVAPSVPVVPRQERNAVLWRKAARGS
jgi:hypothetical protein